MTVGSGVSIADGNLSVLGTTILSEVHDNIVLTSVSDENLLNGSFIRVESKESGSRCLSHRQAKIGREAHENILSTRKEKVARHAELVWLVYLDAFYTEVTTEGIRERLERFKKGGFPPKFIIIDDGWQSVIMDSTSVASGADNSANFANRLNHIKENHKFQKDGKEGHREEIQQRA